MSIVVEDAFSVNAPDPVAPYGMSLSTFGLIVGGAVSGFGLITRGFLWQLYQVWFDEQWYAPLSSTWTNDNTSITTSWANDNASITTTWADDPNDSTGSYPP